MAEETDMCDYELKRLERIKANRKMLEELFPEGTGMYMPRPVKKRRRRASIQDSQGGSTSGESTPEEGSTPQKKQRLYSIRTVEVNPRRNPSRKARPAYTEEGAQRMTRSMTKSQNAVLMEGIDDEQKMKQVVYRTVRRRIVTDEDESPIELDSSISYDGRRIVTVERSTDKVYDRVRGTTCHQCRQKTLDTKTICHNKNCRGVRGQFCGPCLLNRYGEDLRESLLDSNWVCPPCRKICNCSFCMPKRGKAPTGIMIHVAREAGFDNVHEFLDKRAYD